MALARATRRDAIQLPLVGIPSELRPQGVWPCGVHDDGEGWTPCLSAAGGGLGWRAEPDPCNNHPVLRRNPVTVLPACPVALTPRSSGRLLNEPAARAVPAGRLPRSTGGTP